MRNSIRVLDIFGVGLGFFFSSVVAASPGIIAEVALNPAGDFKVEISDVKGEAIIDGDTVRAEKIVAELKGLKTGMTLRDKHAKEKYLEVEKFPAVELLSAVGKGGKGKARIKMKGIEQNVEGTYKLVGKELKAEFRIKLSDFKITGIKYLGIGVEDLVTVLVTVPTKKEK
jgi:hypothetical protein